VTAAVAIAPAIPGFRSPVLGGLRNCVALITEGHLRPPTGRTLFEFVADAAPFQREALIKGLKPAHARALREVARGMVDLTTDFVHPRMIITGDADIFAPHGRMIEFADAINAQLVTLQGRGHWLVGGRALERVVSELQRFLVKAIGRELLLLYPEDPA
jgi:pimeloyl-ACP methyl ester carboxylesterase